MTIDKHKYRENGKLASGRFGRRVQYKQSLTASSNASATKKAGASGGNRGNRYAPLLSDIMEDKTDDYDYEEDDYSGFGTKDGKVPQVELPARPTNYEVWARSHEVIEEKKEPLVLNEDDWSELVGRLHASAKTKQMLLMKQQHKLHTH